MKSDPFHITHGHLIQRSYKIYWFIQALNSDQIWTEHV